MSVSPHPSGSGPALVVDAGFRLQAARARAEPIGGAASKVGLVGVDARFPYGAAGIETALAARRADALASEHASGPKQPGLLRSSPKGQHHGRPLVCRAITSRLAMTASVLQRSAGASHAVTSGRSTATAQLGLSRRDAVSYWHLLAMQVVSPKQSSFV